jgi:hypothetical protein
MTATYEKIATTTLGSAQATVTFSTISSAYTDLVVIYVLKSTAGDVYPYIRLNSDTGTNYSFTRMTGTGSATSGRGTNTAVCYMAGNAGATTTNFNYKGLLHIMNYSNTTTYKTMLLRAGNPALGTDAGVGLWRNTAAVTTVTIVADSSTFTSGSTFTLYGIKSE